MGSSQDISLPLFQNSSLGVGTILIPDINTTVALMAVFSQVDCVILDSVLLSQHGDVPPDFHFQAPPKRGRPRGSKSKKGSAKAGLVELETGELKMGIGPG